MGEEQKQNAVLIFDLDGTLVDSVYEHVLAWREALRRGGIELPNWRIHRFIGMSGGLIVHALAREAGRSIADDEAERLQKFHGEEYSKWAGETRLLPGARELLDALDKAEIRWAIASSGRREKQQHAFDMLKIGKGVPLVTRDDVQHAKPAPDLFEVAAEKLGADLKDCMVVGDSIWDLLAARRARALGIGLLSGGYGESELTQAGAYRVYRDPADMLAHLEEMGFHVKA